MMAVPLSTARQQERTRRYQAPPTASPLPGMPGAITNFGTISAEGDAVYVKGTKVINGETNSTKASISDVSMGATGMITNLGTMTAWP
jgi:hypothetical protein